MLCHWEIDKLAPLITGGQIGFAPHMDMGSSLPRLHVSVLVEELGDI
ncbi:hypothetical protein R9C00_06165 [Flammeovirgaceae bacterium SG7u.111]|nr:hypothetical protein [Flammeovirgaceae bacterium SG7u.132]WPO37026.1 hypothetical protein R9C00_06165 [Flammeovirgaceae bacterium SG7u.111]